MRLSWLDGAREVAEAETEGEHSFVDRAKSFLKVKDGDLLVFIDGSGLELTFLAVARFVRIERTVADASGNEGPWRIYVREASRFPEEGRLGDLMYSLTQVANFKTPSLHFKHHGRMADADLQTILEGTVSWERSVYYGLLRNLPSEWREYVQAAASVAQLSPGDPDAPGKLKSALPIDSLVAVLEEVAYAPAVLASEIRRLRAAVETFAPPAEQVVLEDEVGTEWNLSRFINLAGSARAELADDWDRNLSRERRALEVLDPGQERFRGLEWRLPHW